MGIGFFEWLSGLYGFFMGWFLLGLFIGSYCFFIVFLWDHASGWFRLGFLLDLWTLIIKVTIWAGFLAL